MNWLKIDEIAPKRVSEILDQYLLIFHVSKKDLSILNEIRRKAQNGFIPNPDSLEKIAYERNNPNFLALAAFFHRELGRFLISLNSIEKKYLKEIVGAYLEAISLLIATLIINKNKNCNNELLSELIRTISELLLIMKKEQSNGMTSIIRVLELIASKLVMIESVSGEKN